MQVIKFQYKGNNLCSNIINFTEAKGSKYNCTLLENRESNHSPLNFTIGFTFTAATYRGKLARS